MFGFKVALHTPLIEYHNRAQTKGNKKTHHWQLMGEKNSPLITGIISRMFPPLQPCFLILLIVFY